MKLISAKLQALAIASALTLVWAAESPAQTDVDNTPRSAPSHLNSNERAAANQRLEFDVASIREVAPDSPSTSNIDLDPSDYFRYKGGPVVATGLLINYIIFAFKIADTSQYPLIAAQLPKWAQAERYQLEARSPIANPTKDQIRLMVQTLLADRFHLKLHTAMRDGRVYELKVRPQGPGPQLKQYQGTPLCGVVSAVSPKPAGSRVPAPSCGILFWKNNDLQHMRIMDQSMTEIAGTLSLLGGRVGEMDPLPVMNRTGLTGKWVLNLDFARERTGPSAPADESLSLPGPDFIQALSDQAGLVLTKGIGKVPSYVIDHVEPASPN
ncbi:hypothetical protein GCM10011507_08410 [Edaphobacter acidisoli]|uniref:TIGR03435 family protein n=1 Tax=Edaphobacter acidisoli TaxID=2040573 RepID=A0A916RJT2_9BACT|nr:TIGR03435 family protein [Edaphobacter acidisoli]GGA59331.1 hypothetical protein GCM10011507_08410 [Edaphobacter acidisoli]